MDKQTILIIEALITTLIVIFSLYRYNKEKNENIRFIIMIIVITTIILEGRSINKFIKNK